MTAIHPTAIIHPTAELADGVEVGPYCVIGPKSRLGAGTRLLHHVSIVERTILGEGNEVYPFAVLGADPQDKKFVDEETWLHIGDRNVFRESVTVNRGTRFGGGETRIGHRCLIMAACHIAHDCILGNDITMANTVLLGGHVVVEDNVGFGGLSALHHYVTVGRLAFVGGASRINMDVPPFLISEGRPARVRAVNRVGLKRQGMGEELIGWLKDAQRLLFHEGLQREEALERMRAIGPIPTEGKYLFEFMSRRYLGKQGRALQP
ncbi:MAG: acyl-ACP--UDP-N-acetylglucosamine O-acyltransferase [Planctomycetota bacterium]